MTKKIQVKETEKYYGDFEGSLESIISQLKLELDEGWEGIETEYERDYGEITFARTLLECIEVDYEYPWSDGK